MHNVSLQEIICFTAICYAGIDDVLVINESYWWWYNIFVLHLSA